MNSFFLCIWPSSQDPCTSGVQKVVFAPVAFFYRKGIEFGKKYTILYRQEIFSAGMAFSGLIALYAIATKVMALFLLSIGAMIAFLLAFWAWKTCEKNWTDSLGEHNRVLYEVVVEFGDPAISVGMPSFQDGIAALRKTHV